MRKTSIVFLLIIVFVFTACKSGWYVVPDSQADSYAKTKGLAYRLPRTALHVDVEINVHQYVPGPFSQFAASYLNIENVEQQPKFFWDLKTVEINAETEADPDALFWIVPDPDLPNIHLEKQSILSGINASNCDFQTYDYSFFNPIKLEHPEKILFTDLGVKRNQYEVLDTLWREIVKDSVIQKIPYYKSVERDKEWHQKAQDAANFIIKIRKRRFKLQAAIEEQQADGEGVGVMIEKLEDLEQQYVELFTGKTISVSEKLHFRIVPESNQSMQRFVLANLDIEDATRMDEADNQVKKLVLEVSAANNLSLSQQKNEDSESGLYVRDSGNANCRLLVDNHLVYEVDLPVPQLFNFVHLSRELMNENSQILVNPQTGSLIEIK
jgi:hypothetical protein